MQTVSCRWCLQDDTGHRYIMLILFVYLLCLFSWENVTEKVGTGISFLFKCLCVCGEEVFKRAYQVNVVVLVLHYIILQLIYICEYLSVRASKVHRYLLCKPKQTQTSIKAYNLLFAIWVTFTRATIMQVVNCSTKYHLPCKSCSIGNWFSWEDEHVTKEQHTSTCVLPFFSIIIFIDNF